MRLRGTTGAIALAGVLSLALGGASSASLTPDAVSPTTARDATALMWVVTIHPNRYTRVSLGSGARLVVPPGAVSKPVRLRFAPYRGEGTRGQPLLVPPVVLEFAQQVRKKLRLEFPYVAAMVGRGRTPAEAYQIATYRKGAGWWPSPTFTDARRQVVFTFIYPRTRSTASVSANPLDERLDCGHGRHRRVRAAGAPTARAAKRAAGLQLRPAEIRRERHLPQLGRGEVVLVRHDGSEKQERPRGPPGQQPGLRHVACL